MKSKVIVYCVLLFCLKVASVPLEESVQQKAYQPSIRQGNPSTAEHFYGTGIARTQNMNSMYGQEYSINQGKQQLNHYGFDNHPPSFQSLQMKERQINFASNTNERRSESFPSGGDPDLLKTDNPPLIMDNEQREKQNWPSQDRFDNSPSSTIAGQKIPSRSVQETFHGRGQPMPTHTRPANHRQHQADRIPTLGRENNYHQTAELPGGERHVPRSGPVSESLNRLPVRYVNHNEAPGAAINTNLAKAGNYGDKENSPVYSGRDKPTHYKTFNSPPANIPDNLKSVRNTNNYLKPPGLRNIYNGHALPLNRDLNYDNTGYVPTHANGLRSNNQFSNNQVHYNHIPNYQVPKNQVNNNQIPNNRVLNHQAINKQVLNNQTPSDHVPHNQGNNNQVPDTYKIPTGQPNTAPLKISAPIKDNRYGDTLALNPRSNNEPSIHNAHIPINKTVVTKHSGSPASNFERKNLTPMNTYNGVPVSSIDSVLPSGERNPLTIEKPIDSYNVASSPVDTMIGENNKRMELHHVSNFGPSNSSPPEEVNLYKGFIQHVSSAPDRKTEADSYMNSQLENIFSSRTNRYVIIHPNGTVENIDGLDQIKDTKTDYILVKKKEPSVDDISVDSPPLASPSDEIRPASIEGQSIDSSLNAPYNNPRNDHNTQSRAQLQNNNKIYKPLPVSQPGNDNTASLVFQSPSNKGYNLPAEPQTDIDYIPPAGPLIPNYNNDYNPSPVPQSIIDKEYNPPSNFPASNDYNPQPGLILDNSRPSSKPYRHISPNSASTTTTAAPEDEVVGKYLDSLPNNYKNPSAPLLSSGNDHKLPIEPLDPNGNNDDHRKNPTSVTDQKTTSLKLHTVISPGKFISTTPKPNKEYIQEFVDSVFHTSKDDSLSVIPLFDPSGENNDWSPRRLPLDDNDYELYSSVLDDNSTTSLSTVNSTSEDDETFLVSLTKADDIPSSTPSAPSGTHKYPSSSSKLSSGIDYSTTPLPLTSDSSSSSITASTTTSPVEKTTTDQIITISPIELATDNVKDGAASPSSIDEVTSAYDKQNTTNNSTLSPEYANIKDIMQRSVAQNNISELYDLILQIINENNSSSIGDKLITQKDVDKITEHSKLATSDSLTKTDFPAASDDNSAVTTNSTKQNDANTGDISTTGDNLLGSKAHTSDLTISISIPNDSDGTITIHVEVPDSTGNEETSGDDTVVLNIDTKNCSSTHSPSEMVESTSASGCNKNQTTSDEFEKNKNKLFDLSSTAVVFNKTSDQALFDQLANNSAVNVIYIFQMQPLIQPIVERNKHTTYYENGTIVEEISETTWEDKDDPSHSSVKKKIITHPGEKRD